MPNEANAKVYIFNDAENISAVSQNALLKVLEEPPKSVIFIINCKEKTNLLDTVISRATVFICDEKETESISEEILNIIRTASKQSEYELLSLLQGYSNEKGELLRVFDELIISLRLLYRLKVNGKDFEEDTELLETLTLNRILNAIDILIDAKKDIMQNKAVKIIVARTCIKLKKTLGR